MLVATIATSNTKFNPIVNPIFEFLDSNVPSSSSLLTLCVSGSHSLKHSLHTLADESTCFAEA